MKTCSLSILGILCSTERGECLPHRMDDDFLIRFLRTRNFNVNRAHRLVSFNNITKLIRYFLRISMVDWLNLFLHFFVFSERFLINFAKMCKSMQSDK